jgi:hypothetical protein
MQTKGTRQTQQQQISTWVATRTIHQQNLKGQYIKQNHPDRKAQQPPQLLGTTPR